MGEQRRIDGEEGPRRRQSERERTNLFPLHVSGDGQPAREGARIQFPEEGGEVLGGLPVTLLDASTTLVDAAKQLPGNRHLDRAIKRMEQRIQVLRLRSAKARRQRRHKAFWEAMRLMPSGVLEGTNIAIFICPQCKKTINFGTFVQHAEISGHGSIKSLFCPACDWPLFEPK